MTSLSERFDEVAAAWRRRRVRAGLMTAAGGCTAVVLVVAVAVGMSSGAHRGTAGPTPTGSSAAPPPSSTTDGERGFPFHGAVLGATATDGDHFYALQAECPTDQVQSCDVGGSYAGPVDTLVLLGSDDAGQTWTVRSRDLAGLGEIEVPAPGVLLTSGLVGNVLGEHVSTDGGQTWTALTGDRGGTVQTVPVGGWLACVSTNTGTAGDCTLYAVDLRIGGSTRLANQPPIAVNHVEQLPAGAGFWVTGWAPGSGSAAVAVSLDRGRTWTEHVFGPGEPDYPASFHDEYARTASLDGTTAYTVVSVTTTDETQRRSLVYRTEDAGKTWQRMDPQYTLPWKYMSSTSFLAADGTHLVATVIDDPNEWYGSRNGGASYQRPAGLTGLTGIQDMRHPVQVIAPGVYVTHDAAAVFRSTDGLHWTRLPLPARPR